MDDLKDLKMVTMDGRNAGSVHEAMASVFAVALEQGHIPFRWELGFFIHRDLIRAKMPNMGSQPWQPIATAWGAPIATTTLEDAIALLVLDRNDGSSVLRFVPEGY